ncbi:hypothetical protein QC763_115950 [Podospora pseudopauciseta]|uniref:Uncharacterized protein n=2 Tax=Podospora TaxID=5144 RepID=A0ABR0I0K3_9PEZI|nr:hypothetical protein QC763_115950 [Podospora pseudopauciseta]KAK4682390.1 hypothetical protein QC764_115950 [Podospora pseudoanserina]
MSANPDSVGNQGEFRSRVPPSRPMDTHGHQIGQPIGREAIPEFHAKTYPPGSAPKESTFYPNPIHEIPGQAMNPNMDPSLRTSALDIPGADSKEIYNESGAGSRPIEGQTANEIRHEKARKTDRLGIAAHGGTDTTGDGSIGGILRERGMELPGDKERKVLGKGISATERDAATSEEIGSGGRG